MSLRSDSLHLKSLCAADQRACCVGYNTSLTTYCRVLLGRRVTQHRGSDLDIGRLRSRPEEDRIQLGLHFLVLVIEIHRVRDSSGVRRFLRRWISYHHGGVDLGIPEDPWPEMGIIVDVFLK